jgi:hypothetical protein
VAASVGENFLYVFKAARNGPLTPPPGRVPGPPLALWPGHAERPAAGVKNGHARTAEELHQHEELKR